MLPRTLRILGSMDSGKIMTRVKKSMAAVPERPYSQVGASGHCVSTANPKASPIWMMALQAGTTSQGTSAVCEGAGGGEGAEIRRPLRLLCKTNGHLDDGAAGRHNGPGHEGRLRSSGGGATSKAGRRRMSAGQRLRGSVAQLSDAATAPGATPPPVASPSPVLGAPPTLSPWLCPSKHHTTNQSLNYAL